MRLFVAIDLDEEARRAIGAEQKRLMEALGAGRSLKWVKPADMHLTLAFIGEVEASRTPDIIDAIGIPVSARPFDVGFARVGVFPRHGAPSVLWLGVSAGLVELTGVQKEIADRLERVGVNREARPYQPHLTLARWRARGTGDRSDRRRVTSADRDREVARTSVRAVVLYQSQISSDGPKYSVLARGSLQS